jgi:hypothetical protein
MDAHQRKPPANAPPPSDADFKSFVLYTRRGDAACARAQEALARNPGMRLDTLTQDVEALSQRPPWLDTVPMLVARTEKKAYKADAVAAFIAAYKPRGPPPQSTKRSGALSGVKMARAWSSYTE